MTIPLSALRVHFGTRSALAQQMLPALYHGLPARALDQPLSKKLVVKTLAAPYQLGNPDPPRLIFALQTYYALIVKLIAARAIATIPPLIDLESGAFFERHGITGMTVGAPFDAYLEQVDVQPMVALAAQLTDDQLPLDPLKPLYQDLFPRTVRHALGEYYTPLWLAEQVLHRLDFDGTQTILDPACGSGIFLVMALTQMRAAGIDNPLQRIAGIDVNPLACLSAQVTLLLYSLPGDDAIMLPIYQADSILHPPDIGQFDLIAGNPPWVNWETLSADYRQQTRHLWQHYGLFPHSGMDAILGKGKKDLALLMTYVVADRYLRKGGKLSFILTDAALKSGAAGAGFRRFALPHTPLAALHVDDLTRLAPFKGASTHALILTLQKGTPTQFPVSYVIWRKKHKRKPVNHDATRTAVQKDVDHVTLAAQPISTPDSAWMRGTEAALNAIRHLRAPTTAYDAHAGVYTGGANAVYWLDVIADEGEMLRVRNVIAGSKRPVPQVETVIERDYVFPFLRGRDVRRWQAQPSLSILVVQDAVTRRGLAADHLQAVAPHTLTYLAQFEAILRQRAAFKRYFKASAPFWTMFDVGAYTFKPYKVVWKGFGVRQMAAAVIGSIDGKAIMTNQAMHPFIGLDNADEAHYLAACLNSPPFDFAVQCHTQAGGKSFAQPGILKTLYLPQYDPNSTLHRDLTTLSRQAHDGQPDDDALADCAAALWGLTQDERNAIRVSMDALRL